MKTFEWIEKNIVLALHKIQLARFGGKEGLRDEGLLESALAKAKNYYLFQNIVITNELTAHLASKYAIGIIKNDPFIDGNKRTGLILLHLFLRLNGKKLHATEEEQYIMVIGLASGSITEDEFTTWAVSNTSSLF